MNDHITKSMNLVADARIERDGALRIANELAKFLEMIRFYAPREFWPPIEDTLQSYKSFGLKKKDEEWTPLSLP